MVMEIVREQGYSKDDTIKTMTNMRAGEICYLDDIGYILRISDSSDALFLILEAGDDDECDYYSFQAAKEIQVREIQQDESITIKFS